MKLTPAEQKAVHFVLFVLAVSLLARFLNRSPPLQIGTDASLAGAPAGSRGVTKSDRKGPLVGKLDPNQASAADLDRLPGIGPTTAKRIVEARKDRRFETAMDLRRVKGMTAAKARAVAKHLTVPLGDTTASGTSRKSATRSAPTERTREPASRRARAAAPSPPSASARSKPGPKTHGPAAPKLDLNRATGAQLESIPGIGPALASRLLATRDSLRGFRDWTQVDAVNGIGPALLVKLKAAARL